MIYIYHHNDMDGYGAASIALNYYNIKPDACRELSHSPKDAELLKEPKACDTVVIVDYSFSEATVNLLTDLIDKLCHVIWIDHHQTSVDLLESRPDLKEKKGLDIFVSNEYSGTLLTYLYFYDSSDLSKAKDVPMHLQYISDYDTFSGKLKPKSDYFKLAYDAAIDKFEVLNRFLFLYFRNDIEEYERLLSQYITDGTAIKKYIDSDNASYLNLLGFESTLEDGTKVYVVNKASNSWIFGEKYYQYPAVVTVSYNGEFYRYSMFSYNNGYDCAAYAEKHGGGGHKGAAGWRSDHMMFKKN